MNANAADVYAAYFPGDDSPTMAHCELLAGILARNVKRLRPWQAKYIWNLVEGKQTPGPKLQEALNIQAGKLDGSHPWLLIAQPVRLQRVNGAQIDDDVFIDIDMRICQTCGVKFIPNDEKRLNCKPCRPPRKR